MRLHKDAPPVPEGKQPKIGVEYGCGDSNCDMCHEDEGLPIIAQNGYTVTPDENGRLRDGAGCYGYHTRLSGMWVCYTCGHLCECGDEE